MFELVRDQQTKITKDGIVGEGLEEKNEQGCSGSVISMGVSEGD